MYLKEEREKKGKKKEVEREVEEARRMEKHKEGTREKGRKGGMKGKRLEGGEKRWERRKSFLCWKQCFLSYFFSLLSKFFYQSKENCSICNLKTPMRIRLFSY